MNPSRAASTKEGTQAWGPAGGGIWAAPTIDARRRVLYVSTGNGYSDPPQPTTDAVIAMDLDTGKTKWVAQPGPEDVWMMGCRPENPDNPRCPAKQGPDHDFSMSPMLAKRTNGRDILIIQSKSGMAYGFDPDKQGAMIWQYRTSAGSGLGGQWGGAVDDKLAYFGVNAFLSQTPGGMRAVKIDTGEEVWSKPPADKLCGTDPRVQRRAGRRADSGSRRRVFGVRRRRPARLRERRWDVGVAVRYEPAV